MKPLLADKILVHLKTDFSLEDICDCAFAKDVRDIQDVIIDREDLDDEKEDEFAILAARELQDVEKSTNCLVHNNINNEDEDEDEDDDEGAEVENLLDQMEL